MQKFIIQNMGCKSNQLEGALITEKLVNSGYENVKKIEDADIFILNSCSVTHKSDNEALYILRHAKHKNPKITTVLTGCVAQLEKENLLKEDYIDIVLGNDDKLNILSFLPEKQSKVSDIMSQDTFTEVLLHDLSKTRANLKIQDGCNNRCTYCTICLARGKSRSASIPFLLKQIKIFEEAGFKEIVLTGINIGQWKRVENGIEKNLLDLLKEIEEKTNIERYRLGSLNPLEINDDFLDFLSTSKKFCPHFHLSLQSLCDKTLKNMNRKNTAQDAIFLMEKITDKFENAFIGADIIAGFPDETEADFEETLCNLKKSSLTKIHTFPYSKRKNTVAASMENQVSDVEKNRRADVIKELSNEKYLEFLKKNKGKILNVMIEKKRDKSTGFLKGVSENYIQVLIDSKDDSLKNTIQKVIIQDMDKHVLGTIFQ